MTHFKTVETNTEPAFILTNDAGSGYSPNGAILLIAHFYDGDEGEVAPKLTLETDGVILIDRDDIKKLIAALEEFL